MRRCGFSGTGVSSARECGCAKMRRCSALCHQAMTTEMAISTDGMQRYIIEVITCVHFCRIGHSEAIKNHYHLLFNSIYDERTKSSPGVEVPEMSHWPTSCRFLIARKPCILLYDPSLLAHSVYPEIELGRKANMTAVSITATSAAQPFHRPKDLPRPTAVVSAMDISNYLPLLRAMRDK